MNQVVPSKQLDRAVNALAAKLVQNLPESARYTREQLGFWKDLPWAMTAGHARDWLTVHTTAWEPFEGVQAFLDKRPAITSPSAVARPPAPLASPHGERPQRPARTAAPKRNSGGIRLLREVRQ